MSLNELYIFRLCKGGELLDRILSRYSYLMLSRIRAILYWEKEESSTFLVIAGFFGITRILSTFLV